MLRNTFGAYHRHFYYEGELYRLLHANRKTGIVEAWHCADEEVVTLSYQAVKWNFKKAYRQSEVAKMLGYASTSTFRAALSRYGDHEAFGTLTSSPNMGHKHPSRQTGRIRYYNDEDILKAHETIMDSKIRWSESMRGMTEGRQKLPSREKIRAILSGEAAKYVKDPVTGEFVLIFDA